MTPHQMFVRVAAPHVGDDEVQAVSAVIRSGQYISGPIVEAFEQEFAASVGVKHAVAVNSGTAALHAALNAIGIQPGDHVIVPALSFVATATAVVHQGAVPIFADIDLNNYCLSPEDVAKRITPRTKAIIVVHYFGHAADMDSINRIAAQHNLKVIEDCAQSHGTTYRGAATGTLGDLGAFSFFATKHMTTGEGGMITTDNADWARSMRCFRGHGIVGRDDHVMLGYNYRMTEIAAAMGRVQLRKVHNQNARRRDVTHHIINGIRDVEWLIPPCVPEHVHHTFFWCHIGVREEVLGRTTRDLVALLASRGVEVRNRYWEPLYRQPIFGASMPPILRVVAGNDLPDYRNLHLPNAERTAGRVIGLPNRPDMSPAEIDHVISVVRSV
jgi:perosamine synthetase